MSDFSDIVYKCPGQYFGSEGTTFDSKGVTDEDEFEDLLKSGWYKTMPEAIEAFKQSK
jgi:hypothetical protein